MKRLPVILFVLLACGPLAADTFVSGSASGTWSAAGNPYVVLSPGATVDPGDTLTIEAGVQVRFETDAALTAFGDLTVNGSPSQPVVFESSTQPSVPGSWYGVQLESGTHRFSHAVFRDAFTGINNGLSGASQLTVEDCTFSNVDGGVYHQGAGSLSVTDSIFLGPGPGIAFGVGLGPDVTVRNNSFDGCVDAMLMPATAEIDLGGNSAVNGTVNGIRVFGGTPIVGTTSWDGDDLPFVLDGETVRIDPGGTLTLLPGTVIKSLDGFDDASVEVRGDLVVSGTPQEPVVFTSLRDDSVLGDTNGDGSASSPDRTDWNGIRLHSGSATLQSARVRYAITALDSGWSGPSDVNVSQSVFDEVDGGIFHHDGGSLSVTGSVFLGPGPGVILGSGLGTDLTVQGNVFDGCADAVLLPANASVSFVGNTAINGTLNGIRVFGGQTISDATTWSADSMPYVIDGETVTIDPNGSLTIEAGTVIKSLGGFEDPIIDVSGNLTANGTAARPVVFTSLRDDAVLGDTNGDGAGTLPDAGDWAGIRLQMGATSLAWTELRHVATAIDSGWSGPSDITVSHGSFENADGGVFHHMGGRLSVTGSTFRGPGPGIALGSGLGPDLTVQDNLFDGCVEAIMMPAAASIDLGGNRAVNGSINGIRVFGGDPITASTTWDADTMPFVLQGESVTIDSGATLTIRSGAVVKSLNEFGSAGLEVSGTLIVAGTQGRPAIFTSLKDDTVLGDTNADGAATSPVAGDWDRIHVNGGTAHITGAWTRYASAGVVGHDAILEVRSSRFLHGHAGVEATGVTTGMLYDSVLAQNDYGIAVGDQPTFTVGQVGHADQERHGNNDIYCNGWTDLIFAGMGTLPAQGNWWGELPPDPTEIETPGGGVVDYSGYLTGVRHDLVELSLSRLESGGVQMTWPEPTSCTAYRVQRSLDPQFGTIDLDQPLVAGTTLFDDPTTAVHTLVFYRVQPE